MAAVHVHSAHAHAMAGAWPLVLRMRKLECLLHDENRLDLARGNSPNMNTSRQHGYIRYKYKRFFKLRSTIIPSSFSSLCYFSGGSMRSPPLFCGWSLSYGFFPHSLVCLLMGSSHGKVGELIRGK